MNAQNAKDYLPLVQALADGKTIQFFDGASWVDIVTINTLLFDPDVYRVKPEPRTFEMWLCAEDGGMITTETYKFCMLHRFPKHYECITVQEVLK